MKTLPIKLATLALVLLVLSEHLSEAKKRNPNTQVTHHRRRRPPPPRPSTIGLPPPPKPKKKKSILTSLFNRKNKKHGGGGRGRRVKSHNGEESKRVYYYSLPTQKPRIILGEELNFSELGIHNAKTKHHPKQYQHQPAEYIQEDSDYYNPSTTNTKPNNPYNNHPKYYKKPRVASNPPGYRIRDNWEDHYVLEHNNRPTSTKDKKRHPPKVMDSVMRAAGELRNAYKAAVIGSAKVAHYTGAAASNYFKGVRNIFSGGRVGSGGSYRKKDVSESDSADKLKSDLVVPSPSLLSNNDEEEHEATQTSSSIPSVHLDWGSSFWKLFYNKSGRNVGSLSQVESRVDQIVNNS